MGIHAIGAMRRAKLMIGGRILALAVQFTLARDATAQLAIDRACALSACPATVAQNTGNCGFDVYGEAWRQTMQHAWTSSECGARAKPLCNRCATDGEFERDIEPIRITAE